MMALRVWVVRHGETEDNKTRTIAGHNAGKLSALGVAQACMRGPSLLARFLVPRFAAMARRQQRERARARERAAVRAW